MSPEERRKIQINARLKFRNWFKTPDAVIMSAHDDADGQLLDLSVIGAADGLSVFHFVRDRPSTWNQFENAVADAAEQAGHIAEMDKALQWPYFLQELKTALSNRLVLVYDAEAHIKIVKRAFDLEIQPICLKEAHAELYAQWNTHEQAWSIFELVEACKKVGLHSTDIYSAVQSGQLTRKLLEHIGAEKMGHVNARFPIGEAIMISEGQVGIAYQHIYNDDLFELEHGGWYTVARKPVTKLEMKKCKATLETYSV